MKNINKDTKNIAIIIPVFNNIKYTKQCLGKLLDLISSCNTDHYSFQIVVIDDGSRDGTASWVKSNHPSVHLLKGTGELWWSGGINKGMRYAVAELDAEYVLWWNNDIQPKPDYLQQVLRLISDNEKNVIIGSKVYILNKNLIWGMGGKFNPVTGRRHMYGEQQKDTDAYKKPLEVDWMPGMGTLLHRNVIERIGMVDEQNFPQYHGDSDYTFRAKKAGFRLIVFPELIIYNDNTNTGLKHNGRFRDLYKTMTSIKSNYNLNKDITFMRKHANSPKAYIFLFNKYFKYIGGFLKWKILNMLGVRK